MFEGAFSPWHLVIIAVALFLVVGPKRIANRLTHVGKTVQRFVDDDARLAGDDGASVAPAGPISPAGRHGLAYRLGRRLRRRRGSGRSPT